MMGDMIKPQLGSPVEVFTRKMFTHIIQRLAAFLSENRLSVSEIAALHIVGQERVVTVKTLGEKINLSISATSRLVSGLVKKKLFVIKGGDVDARVKFVACSKEGLRLLDHLSAERVGAIFDLAQTLPPEVPRQILGVIAQLARRSKNGN